MSGGVDSSVAAYLLQQQGFEVIGVTMKLFGGKTGEDPAARAACCSFHDFQDARKVASRLGIRHYTVNYREDFQDLVINPFVETYLRGLTPSPCILCNSLIKFDKLLRFAHCLGVKQVATGHYAINQYDDITGRHLIYKGADQRKDQSYFLFDLDQDQLGRVLFPLGGMTKDHIRELAREIGLPVAGKEESQEICFVPDGNYRNFIHQYLEDHPASDQDRSGEIVRKDGTVVGRHQGVHHFTVGQRRGLKIAAEHPLYVIGINSMKNQVVVGGKEDLGARRFFVTRCNWIAVPGLFEEIEVEVKIRSRFVQAAACLRPAGESGAEVIFHDSQPAITPGQAAVFYWGEVVVGGGWIYKVDLEYT